MESCCPFVYLPLFSWPTKGIPYFHQSNKCYATNLDLYSIRVTQSNHPQTLQSDYREYLYPITIVLIFSSLGSNINNPIYHHNMYRFLLSCTSLQQPHSVILHLDCLIGVVLMNSGIIKNSSE